MSKGIVLTGITKKFGDALAVDRVDLAFEPEKLTVILGPSGCGKTTILRMIAGLEMPSSGNIEIDGRTVVGEGRVVPTEERNIGIVFQSYALWPHMTVSDNIAFPLRMRRVPRPERQARVAEMARLVQLEPFLARYPQQLSGGQQQRVALARALVAHPTTLLLDEPLANLDARLRDSMRSEIKRLQRETRTTAAHVTHDQAEAMALADHVIVMDHGVVMGQGAPRDLYQSADSLFVARFLGDLNEVPAQVQASDASGNSVRALDQTLRVAARQGRSMTAGSAAILAFRPADTTIVSDAGRQPAPGVLTLGGQVHDLAFEGVFQILKIGVGDRMITAYHSPHEVLLVGQPVSVLIPEERLLVFPPDPQQRFKDGPAAPP